MTSSSKSERRVKRRFPIQQDVCYKMLQGQRIAKAGRGKIVNISSGGVWFTTEQLLTPGSLVELSICWPVLLNNSCPINLVICGCVIRSTDDDATITIDHCEFRTRGAQALQQPASQPAVKLRLPG